MISQPMVPTLVFWIYGNLRVLFIILFQLATLSLALDILQKRRGSLPSSPLLPFSASASAFSSVSHSAPRGRGAMNTPPLLFWRLLLQVTQLCFREADYPHQLTSRFFLPGKLLAPIIIPSVRLLNLLGENLWRSPRRHHGEEAGRPVDARRPRRGWPGPGRLLVPCRWDQRQISNSAYFLCWETGPNIL